MRFEIKNNVLIKYIPSNPEEKTVIIPEGVEIIEPNAFNNCKMKKVILPESLKKIEKGAFCICGEIESLTIPKNVEVIEECAFFSCVSLKNVTIENGVKHIKERAFIWCGKYANDIYIPESVETIGIESLSMFASINVSEDNKNFVSLDGVLFNKDMTKILQIPFQKSGVYVIPETVVEISSNAFEDCGQSEVIIKSNVKAVDSCAFIDSLRLEKITIPDNTYIGKGNFIRCSNLNIIVLNGKKSTITINKGFNIYGECFPEKIFEFISEWDIKKKEDILFSLRNVKYKIPLAVYMLMEYDSEVAGGYVKKNLKKVMAMLIDSNNSAGITKILESGYITKRNIDVYIKYSIEAKKPEIQVILSKYKNDNFGFDNNFDKLKL